jgi:uncharacterized coiled-coil DUF342 family protein
MSKEITEKEKVINEEIERYYGESRKALAELSSLFDVIRNEVETISVYGKIERFGYYLRDIKTGVKGVYEDLLVSTLDETYDNFEKIIENARKTREKINEIKYAAGSVEALRKAL